MTIPVGIDLGTTFSAAAYIDPTGNTAMITNEEGDLLTPSVVMFEDERFVVGKEAAHASITDPDKVAQWVKRDMGRPAYNRPIRGELFPPEVIQACILHKVERSISRELGEDFTAVITVPAYFDESRRAATVSAAEMAGLDVLDIVNEPTAAALAFGETLGYLNYRGDIRKESTVLTYDLGGGTFDVTLLKLAPGDIRTLASDGDVLLGGHDWDLRLVDHLATAFIHDFAIDLRTDPIGFQRLYEAAVEMKHTLSSRSKVRMQVAHHGKTLETSMTREGFELMTADLLERTGQTVRQVVHSVGYSMKQIDRVLLVGGATRMPMVPQMLKEMGATGPARNVNPDEAVARGAAIYAKFLLEKGDAEKRQRLAVTNVSSHTLGLEGIDQRAGRKIVKPVIKKNTPLPATKRKKFCTKEAGQRSIVIHVLEGEGSSPKDCISIGRTVIGDLPPDLPKGHLIHVTFAYGSNGLLNVHAQVEGVEEAHAELTLERANGLPPEAISHWKDVVTHDAGFARFHETIEQLDPVEEGLPATPLEDGEASAGDFDWDEPDELLSMAMLEQREEPLHAEPGDSHSAMQEDATPETSDALSEEAPANPLREEPITHAQEPDDAESGQDPQSAELEPEPAGELSDAARSLIMIGGAIAFGLLGLAAGYLLVSWLFPMLGQPLPW